MSATPFTKIKQVAMVVRDCEETAKRYYDDLGIGPWAFYTLDSRDNARDPHLRGEVVDHDFRVAKAMVGDVQMELIQPLRGASIYVEHLAKHGEGLHHIAFDMQGRFANARARLIEKGYREVQGGRVFDIATYAYFDTDKALASIMEIAVLDKNERLPEPEMTYPLITARLDRA